MRQSNRNWILRTLLCVFCGVLSIGVMAVPAYRGWQTQTQPDGTTIEVRQMGDEFYHYAINRDGQQIKQNAEGYWEVVGEAPTAEVAKARRAKAFARRAPQAIGTTPNLAPRGVVILANFADSKMQSGHTQAVFDELCNAENCTVNQYDGKQFGSAAQYFADQSNGTYRPIFDVFGPVTLSRNVAYYGTDTDPDDEGSDAYAADAVVEACLLANQQFDIDFTQYDSDNDGKVDFVYLIYAGKGQANGGSSETIWPHNWTVASAIAYGNCTYTTNRSVDGKTINNYACSGELTGDGGLSGIGTLCHEFGHVMGLPDLYDTSYGTNYENALTPADWDIMDGGSYNGGEHCPPNYDPWEKFFFGWTDPINPGNEGANITLYPNGSTNQNIYQINSSGTKQGVTSSGLCYYLENRQQSGWDTYLPSHGLLIWKLNFNATAWKNNKPNHSDTSGSPLYTVVCSSGTMIGVQWEYDENKGKWVQVNDGTNNVFPGAANVTSWSGVSGKPVTEITETGNLITCKYMGGYVESFDVTWMANGALFTTTKTTGRLTLPATEPEACEGKVFVGWTATADYESASDAPTFAKNGDAITQATTYYAVFATQGGSGTTTWELMKDDSSLKAGDVLVLACASKSQTAGTLSSGYLQPIASGFATDFSKITALGSGTIELTLGGQSGAWTFANGGKLVGSSNVKTLVWDNGTTTWTISIGTDWNATITNTTSSYGKLQYNASSPRFTTYTSSQTPVQLYRKSGGVSYTDFSTTCTPPEPCALTDITLNTTNVLKEFTTGDEFNSTGLVVTANYSNCSSKTVTPTSISTPEMYTAGVKTVTVSYTENEVTKTATYDITVSDPKTYTIRFLNNGEEVSKQVVIEGQNAEKPADPTACGEYVFAGWSATTYAVDNTTVPTYETTFAATKDQDYHAVFSLTEEEGEPVLTNNYKQITSTDDLTSGNYIVAGYYSSKYYAMKNALTSNGYYINQQQVTPSSNIITTTDGNIIWKITVNSNTLSFYNEAVGKYVHIYQSGSYTNAGLTTSSSDNIHFTYSVESNGWWKFISTVVTTHYLEYYGSGKDFSAYTSAGSDPIYLYKQQSEIQSTTYYTTAPSCEECTSAITLTKGTPANGSFALDQEDGTHSTCGGKFVVTVTDIQPADGYRLSAITQSGIAQGVTIDQEAKTVTYAKKVNGESTINVVFEALPTYTIRFYDDSNLISTQVIVEGKKPLVPEVSECDGYSFVGWWTEALDTDNTTVQKWISDFTATQDADYFAIYQHTEGGGEAKLVEDQITFATTNVSGTSYKNWTAKCQTDAQYSGQSAGGNSSVQLRATSPSGIVSTTSGGRIKKITINWNSNSISGRTIDVYGKNTAYSAPADLYSTSTQGALLGSIVKGTSTELTIKGDYAYVGLRSNNQTLYVEWIILTWDTSEGSKTYYTSDKDCSGSGSAIDTVTPKAPAAVKALRNGQIVIIRGKEIYSITGTRIE